MPLYEYECDACGHRFEKIQKFSDPLEDTCPTCGGPVRKMASSPAIQFKGSGFYITDYPKGEKGSAPKSDGGKSDKADAAKSDTSAKSDKAETATKSDKSSSSGDSGSSTASTPASATAPSTPSPSSTKD